MTKRNYEVRILFFETDKGIIPGKIPCMLNITRSDITSFYYARLISFTNYTPYLFWKLVPGLIV